MTITQRAEAFAMAYAATAKHNRERVDQDHLKAAVLDTITAAILDDRAARPDLATALADQRSAIAEMLAIEARRLKGLAEIAKPESKAQYTFLFAAEICKEMTKSITSMAGILAYAEVLADCAVFI